MRIHIYSFARPHSQTLRLHRVQLCLFALPSIFFSAWSKQTKTPPCPTTQPHAPATDTHTTHLALTPGAVVLVRLVQDFLLCEVPEGALQASGVLHLQREIKGGVVCVGLVGALRTLDLWWSREKQASEYNRREYSVFARCGLALEWTLAPCPSPRRLGTRVMACYTSSERLRAASYVLDS